MKSATVAAKNLGRPDETRRFGHGEMAVVTVDGISVGRSVFDPGFRWSTDVRPIVGTDSCQVAHAGYVISGRLCVLMDDGTEIALNPGDSFVVAPGHDAWVIGDEPCMTLDWAGSAEYARGAATD